MGVPGRGAVGLGKQSQTVTLRCSEQPLSTQAESFKKGSLAAQPQGVWMNIDQQGHQSVPRLCEHRARLEVDNSRHPSLTQELSVAGETGLEPVSAPDGETEAGQHTLKHVRSSGHSRRGAKNKHTSSSAGHTPAPCCSGERRLYCGGPLNSRIATCPSPNPGKCQL